MQPLKNISDYFNIDNYFDLNSTTVGADAALEQLLNKQVHFAGTKTRLNFLADFTSCGYRSFSVTTD